MVGLVIEWCRVMVVWILFGNLLSVFESRICSNVFRNRFGNVPCGDGIDIELTRIVVGNGLGAAIDRDLESPPGS